MIAVRVIQMHEKPIAGYPFALSNHSAGRLEFTLALMSGKKILVPQIENDATTLSHARCQSAKHVAICCRVEIAKALRHDNRNVERAGLRPILVNVGDLVVGAAG